MEVILLTSMNQIKNIKNIKNIKIIKIIKIIKNNFLYSFYILVNSNFYQELQVFLQNKNIFSFYNKLRFIAANDAFGSLWCFSSVFIGIIGILKL